MDIKIKNYAIILGCHKIGLGIIRALGEKNIPLIGLYYNHNDIGQKSKYIFKSYFCPNPDKNEDEFIKFLINLADDWSGSVLIPSDDGTLITVSKNYERLSKLYKVATDNWDIVKKCIQKKETYNIAKKLNIPFPETYSPDSIKDVLKYVDSIQYPCLLKPIVGHKYFENYRRKLSFITDKSHLLSEYKEAVSRGHKMMIQEYIPGDDTNGVNYNTFNLNNEILFEFTASKIRLSPKSFGFPRVVVSKKISSVLPSGRKLIKEIGYNGFSCIEFKKDIRDGQYKLMEINARNNLSSLLAVRTGINFPYIMYIYTDSKIIPKIDNDYKENIYWIDLEKDLLETIKAKKIEKNLFKPYFNKNVFAVLSFKDPMPFIKRMCDAMKIFVSCAFHKSNSFRNKDENNAF